MRILVTGGTGHVGKAVVAHLIENGHEVRVVDRRVEEPVVGAEVVACDVTDFDSLREQARGQEAIIHLAGIPYPGAGTGPEIYRINCTGTFNVFEAAAVEGIRRVACASSINALGYNFGVKSFPIQYFPMDEDHPTFTTDPYSFSKQVLEETAAYYWRRDGISSTCLRMPWVYPRNGEFRHWGLEFLTQYQKGLNKLMAMSERERQELVGGLLRDKESMRSQRLDEIPWEKRRKQQGEFKLDFDNPATLMWFGYTDFWTVISLDDTAQAFEKSLLADFEGSHALYVGESQNFTGLESESLLQVFYPDVKMRKKAILDATSMINFEKAYKLIGFEPQHSMKEQAAKAT
jgi:hypothetical protein